MKLIRVQSSARKTVIYHPSVADVWKRVCCVFGVHEYETVLEYQSVGAKEEMCIHCLKERYSVDSRTALASKAPSVA